MRKFDFSDALAVVGFGSVSWGLYTIYHPLGLIFVGVLLVVISMQIDRGK
jgi:hypothetical protein